MSGLDVEALLDSTAAAATSEAANGDGRHGDNSRDRDRDDDRHRDDRSERRDRDRHRDGSRDRDRDRKRRDRSRDHHRRDRETEGDDLKSPRSDRGSANGSHRSRRRSRSRDDRRPNRRDRDEEAAHRNSASGGDYYRRRSRSPEDDRYYRPSGRGSRREEGDRDRERAGRDKDRKRSTSPSSRRGVRDKTPEPQLTEDERDRRTVFVQQLAARLRTKELTQFFEKVGPVKEAQIVKDRISGRSKGVGYVEFKNEESVPLAIQLTGQKLLGLPIIAQLTEAEKNRQARNPEVGNTGNHNSIPFHRLYVGNIHFSITEQDLQNVFEPFGELEFVQLQKEEGGRSRGYGFVQFRDPDNAREALEKMNGFDLAGRPIRVGLGNDKFTPETTANLMQRFQPGQSDPRDPRSSQYQGSAFSGSGGRGAYAGGSGGTFDRAGGRGDDSKGGGGASALDDTDVAGVNFSNYSRDALMRKLLRTEDPQEETRNANARKEATRKKESLPVTVSQASRCVLLRNMFDPNEEEGDSWPTELEADVKAECEDKYGKVVHISLDPNTQGDIYLKFERVEGGENAIKGLNGRFFGGRQISAQGVVDAVYSSLFRRAKAL